MRHYSEMQKKIYGNHKKHQIMKVCHGKKYSELHHIRNHDF